MRHKHKAELRYPGLWRRCVGAWSPGLGPTGLILRDQSGLGNHGTLTNMVAASDWVISGSKYALSFDGTVDNAASNSYVRAPVASGTSLDVRGASISFGGWFYRRSTGRYELLAGHVASNDVRQYAIYLSGESPDWMYWALGGVSTAGMNVTLSTTIASNVWTHIWLTYADPVVTIYVNGVSAYSASHGGSIVTQSGEFNIGCQANLTYPFNGLSDDVRVYNRVSTANEIRLLSSRRGIAHELTQRHRSSDQISSASVNFNLNNLMMGSSF